MELTCEPGESQCSGTCANLETSDLHCGSCNNHCSPLQGCLDGNCVDKASRCTSIRLWDPQAPDGLYFNPNTGNMMYCDFTYGYTYEAFGFGAHNASYQGYTLMSSADFNNPGTRKAFIALFNVQGGLINLQPGWNSLNCCFKASNAGAGQVLWFGGRFVYPASAASDQTRCNAGYSDERYRFALVGDGPTIYAPLPMPDDFFTMYPPAVGTNCSDSFPMPGIFVKRRGLN